MVRCRENHTLMTTLVEICIWFVDNLYPYLYVTVMVYKAYAEKVNKYL